MIGSSSHNRRRYLSTPQTLQQPGDCPDHIRHIDRRSRPLADVVREQR